MNRQEQIQKSGYSVFELTKDSDSDSTTPIDVKYTAIMLCYQGEAIIEANMQQYHLRKGDSLCLGNVLYKSTIRMSDDFNARVLISLKSFAFNSAVGVPSGFMESLYIKPVAKISDANIWKITNNHLDNLELMQSTLLGLRHNEMIALSFRSIVLIMAMLRGGTKSSKKFVYGQGDVYFKNFIELIEENVNKEHEVAFYADLLHITPKYLSEVCKQKSGHKAKEIISSFLISKIKQEIIMSGKSIKTISYEYGFADQSSMGKFFYKMTGQTPGFFRKTNG
ncbi:MAG: AraC family transcriptional regulator [Muribaculaceae bacterium]|nr:AraC family transcriptional regulator [Muribaculaceae bacterium]